VSPAEAATRPRIFLHCIGAHFPSQKDRRMTAQLHDLFPSPQTATSAGFDACWTYYPNKTKKALAKARYEAVVNGFKTRTLDKDSGMYVELELKASEAEIFAGVKAYVESQIDKRTFKMKDDGKYVPMFAVFLNQGRWMDFT
jgi:hypothetical protein